MIFGGLICFMAFNGSFLFTYYYPYNYAPYYLLVATMILQTGLCEGMLIRFMMKKLREHIIHINTMEEQADKLFIAAMRKLHTTCTDPIVIITWREIYIYLEKCADACEHVADAVESIVMKNT